MSGNLRCFRVVGARRGYSPVPSMSDEKKIAGLQREIRRLKSANRTLRRRVSMADEASQAKSDFLAMISHEIRTPMNGVIGIADLLLDTKLTGKQRKYTELIYSSARDLLTLINSILDFSKLEADRLELEEEEFNLDELIIEVMSLHAIEGTRKGLDVHYSIPPELDLKYLGDKNRLRQVLVNLIGNSIKFTDSGYVVLKATKEEIDNRSHLISFTIEDSGSGIPPERQEDLFLPFAQLDTSSTRRFGGTGLGLTISKKLVELMGGEIGVESTPGKGSLFWFNVRLKPVLSEKTAMDPSPPLTDTGERRPRQVRGPRVLIVEDDATNRLVIEGMLEHTGVPFTFAHNGREAIDKWKENVYDLILMDCQMPVMNGYEATAAILALQKELPEKKKPVIIALTADVTSQARKRCREVGMDAYIEKPIDLNVLSDVVRRLLPDMQHDLFPRRSRRDPVVAPRSSPGDPVDSGLISIKTLERLKQNIGDIRPVLRVFLDRLPKLVAVLKEEAGAENVKVLMEVAHKLKGSCGQFGAVKLARLCTEVGRRGQGGDLYAMEELIGRIERAAVETDAYFRDMLEE